MVYLYDVLDVGGRYLFQKIIRNDRIIYQLLAIIAVRGYDRGSGQLLPRPL